MGAGISEERPSDEGSGRREEEVGLLGCGDKELPRMRKEAWGEFRQSDLTVHFKKKGRTFPGKKGRRREKKKQVKGLRYGRNPRELFRPRGGNARKKTTSAPKGGDFLSGRRK